jgi:molybdate transport system substrate-binding protein
MRDFPTSGNFGSLPILEDPMRPMHILLAASLLAGATHAAEVTVMSGGAVKSAFTAAVQAWEARSGHKVSAVFAPAGDLRRKVAAGEAADIIIVPAENFAELERAGAVDPSTRRDLGVVAMGAAVRKGAPVPDISTPEALRRTLTEVKSLTYMDPARGTSGKHFDESVLPKLGIRDAVRAKATLGEGGFIAEKVARGEVEIAFHQMTEMLPVPGVTIVGPLPPELQKQTVYSAAVMKNANNARDARALLDYLVSAEGRKAFLDRGFTAP